MTRKLKLTTTHVESSVVLCPDGSSMLPSSTSNPNSLKNKELGKKSNKNSHKKQTVQREKLHVMDKKNLRLFTANDDLTKNWFIEYYELGGHTKIRKQVKALCLWHAKMDHSWRLRNKGGGIPSTK